MKTGQWKLPEMKFRKGETEHSRTAGACQKTGRTSVWDTRKRTDQKKYLKQEWLRTSPNQYKQQSADSESSENTKQEQYQTEPKIKTTWGGVLYSNFRKQRQRKYLKA